ncbi:tRNA dihydrouridine synthase A [Litoreibacter arenae DSM 19593]|uniref:tRNA-dihydrouridine synthase n=1 Tax=Litoreibacter arenae DSM 19593 TaxID=1123360 RepID=S9QHH9_9RHOB|nr:tRNA dihydrouridine synthase A [Litoreibacter arenae DSM 19593]
MLYTEMVTAPALVRGGAVHLLDFSPVEHPVAVQLGGSEPDELADAARLCAERGYDEINLNVGCPSDRVQSGCFGAVLMERPALVADCVKAMIEAQPVEVTVKCRLGVDDQDPETVLPDFLSRVRDAGVTRVAIHARKAWLQGLSPKENRDVPPLDYDIVHRMKEAFPDLHISLNGGLETLEAGLPHLETLDGLMYGRAAYHQPWDVLADVDELVFGDAPQTKTRADVVHDMLPYIEAHLDAGGKLAQVTRHMLGLFAGQPGARGWRRILSEGAHKPDAGPALVLQALEAVQMAQAA